MAGKVFFRKGRWHMSRFRHTTEFGAEFLNSLTRILGKEIPFPDWCYLAQSIAMAKSDNDLQTKHKATRKDALAQLRAMSRLKSNDDLLWALRGCDRMTFEAIQQAQTDAISDVLWRDGVFVDAHGEDHCIPPAIEHVGLMERFPPYLPMGFEGVRNAIAASLKTIDEEKRHEASEPSLCLVTRRTRFHPKTGAGNTEKSYQRDLAAECVVFWRSCGKASQRKPWAASGEDKRSRIVAFAHTVFAAAGMRLSDRRMVSLLKQARKARAEELRERRRKRDLRTAQKKGQLTAVTSQIEK